MKKQNRRLVGRRSCGADLPEIHGYPVGRLPHRIQLRGASIISISPNRWQWDWPQCWERPPALGNPIVTPPGLPTRSRNGAADTLFHQGRPTAGRSRFPSASGPGAPIRPSRRRVLAGGLCPGRCRPPAHPPGHPALRPLLLCDSPTFPWGWTTFVGPDRPSHDPRGELSE